MDANYTHEELVERLRESIEANGFGRGVYFSVEPSRGETYANENMALYAHDEYPLSSVLYSRERRVLLWEFEEKDDIPTILKALGIAGKTDICEGSSFVPGVGDIGSEPEPWFDPADAGEHWDYDY